MQEPESAPRPNQAFEIVERLVPCPDCGDLNREARRRCKKRRGACGGDGRVLKFLPAEVAKALDTIENKEKMWEDGVSRKVAEARMVLEDTDSESLLNEKPATPKVTTTTAYRIPVEDQSTGPSDALSAS